MTRLALAIAPVILIIVSASVADAGIFARAKARRAAACSAGSCDQSPVQKTATQKAAVQKADPAQKGVQASTLRERRLARIERR